MKALTVQQPWAQLCVMGAKRYESRTWPTQYRGPLAIHAAAGLSLIGGRRGLVQTLTLPEEDWERRIAAVMTASPLTYSPGASFEGLEVGGSGAFALGAVIGEVTLVDCVLAQDLADLTDDDYAFCDLEIPGMWAWVLENAEAYDKPVPAKGTLGLWEWEVGRGRTARVSR